MSGRRFVLLDRDGTLIEERHYLSRPEQVALLPGAAAGLRRMAAAGWRFVVLTNQSGIARGYFGEAELEAVHARLRELLLGERLVLEGVFHCPHHPDAGCACRKPGTLLAERAGRRLGFDPAAAVVIGDKECDLGLGQALGAFTVLVRTGYGRQTERRAGWRADLVADDIQAAAALLEGRSAERTGRGRREA